MIDIDAAIKESKNKENISDGGSDCFDFGDVVLVKYLCSKKYLKEGEHTREKSEEIMTAINEKAKAGVNTPKHLAVKRVVEGDYDICYVLQEKCPGVNCATMQQYGVSFDKMCASYEAILSIPFEHYRKLISDGTMLYEMGYEAKGKNLFYDKESGFWYIDFLDNNQDDKFDKNNPQKLFSAIKNRIPNLINMTSSMQYNEKLTEAETKKKNLLEYGIKAKTLLALVSVFPNFKRYEKFYLLGESEEYRNYLMQEKIVNIDLKALNEEDYKIFDELYEVVLLGLIDKVVNKNSAFWNIEVNEIRNDCNLFNLQHAWHIHKDNTIKREDYEDSYDYEMDSRELLKEKMLQDLINCLKHMKPNDNITTFLEDANKKISSSNKTK